MQEQDFICDKNDKEFRKLKGKETSSINRDGKNWQKKLRFWRQKKRDRLKMYILLVQSIVMSNLECRL